jgi:hypothetical protein
MMMVCPWEAFMGFFFSGVEVQPADSEQFQAKFQILQFAVSPSRDLIRLTVYEFVGRKLLFTPAPSPMQNTKGTEGREMPLQRKHMPERKREPETSERGETFPHSKLAAKTVYRSSINIPFVLIDDTPEIAVKPISHFNLGLAPPISSR